MDLASGGTLGIRVVTVLLAGDHLGDLCEAAIVSKVLASYVVDVSEVLSELGSLVRILLRSHSALSASREHHVVRSKVRIVCIKSLVVSRVADVPV